MVDARLSSSSEERAGGESPASPDTTAARFPQSPCQSRSDSLPAALFLGTHQGSGIRREMICFNGTNSQVNPRSNQHWKRASRVTASSTTGTVGQNECAKGSEWGRSIKSTLRPSFGMFGFICVLGSLQQLACPRSSHWALVFVSADPLSSSDAARSPHQTSESDVRLDETTQKPAAPQNGSKTTLSGDHSSITDALSSSEAARSPHQTSESDVHLGKTTQKPAAAQNGSKTTLSRDHSSITETTLGPWHALKHRILQVLEGVGLWRPPPVKQAQLYFQRRAREHPGSANKPTTWSPDIQQDGTEQSKPVHFYIPTRLELFFSYRNLPRIRDDFLWDKIGNQVNTTLSDHSVVIELPHLPKEVLKQLGIRKENVKHGVILKMWVFSLIDMRQFMKEAHIHQLLWRHRKSFSFLLPLLGLARSSRATAVYLILPKARDLYRMLQTHPTVDFPLVYAELVCALKDLHDHGIVHRDVKFGNMLVMPDGHVALGDFETVRRNGALTTCAGTKWFMPPETRSCFNSAVPILTARKLHDVYSLGRTFEVLRRIWTMKWKKPVPRETLLADLTSKMTAPKVKERLTLYKVMQHPFFDGLDFGRVRRKGYKAPFSALEKTCNQKRGRKPGAIKSRSRS